jgi:programmed cell death 6-interacting protein
LDALDQEEREDEEMGRLYGPRWTRTKSAALTKKLREKGGEYQDKINTANKSNAVVRQKIDNNLFMVELLGLDKRELEASIPSSTAASTLALKDPNLKKLKVQLDALNKNLKQRPGILENLKKLSANDDIGPKLAQNALNAQPLEESALFEECFKRYDADSKLITDLLAEQEKLLEEIFVRIICLIVFC